MPLPRLLLLLALGTSVWLTLPAAQAHTPSVAHLYVERQGNAVTMEVDLAIRDLALTLPLDVNRDDRVTWAELERQRAPLEQWIRSNVSLSTAAGPCDLVPRGLATRRYEGGAYATVQLEGSCPSGTGFRLRYDLLFAADPQHRVVVVVRNGPHTETAIATASHRELLLGTGRALSFGDYLREGVRHILIGYDHLAFLLSLLLPAALLRRDRKWQPVDGFRPVLLHAFAVVTAFTVAHSLTLGMAALGWVRPASRWVEAAIAASVLLAALNNLKPLITRRVWLVGFGFGLVHGFGFAGALGELGLPVSTRVLALLGFNLGVEMGQLVVVALVLPLLFLVRRRRWYVRVVMPLLSLAIAALAVAWLWQRLG